MMLAYSNFCIFASDGRELISVQSIYPSRVLKSCFESRAALGKFYYKKIQVYLVRPCLKELLRTVTVKFFSSDTRAQLVTITTFWFIWI